MIWAISLTRFNKNNKFLAKKLRPWNLQETCQRHAFILKSGYLTRACLFCSNGWRKQKWIWFHSNMVLWLSCQNWVANVTGPSTASLVTWPSLIIRPGVKRLPTLFRWSWSWTQAEEWFIRSDQTVASLIYGYTIIQSLRSTVIIMLH
jgi:hypothetical protein